MTASEREARKAERSSRRRRSRGGGFVEGRPQKTGPVPLTASQLDPLTGTIDWPLTLEASDFDSQREELEALLKEWASNSGAVDEAAQRRIRDQVRSMHSELKKQIKEISPGEYISSRIFLESLADSV